MWEEGTELQEKIYERFLYLKPVKVLCLTHTVSHVTFILILNADDSVEKYYNEFLDTIFVIVSVKNTIYLIILRKRSFIYESPFFKQFFFATDICWLNFMH